MRINEEENNYVFAKCGGCERLKMNCNTGVYICQHFPIGDGYCMNAYDVLTEDKCMGYAEKLRIHNLYRTQKEINEDLLI